MQEYENKLPLVALSVIWLSPESLWGLLLLLLWLLALWAGLSPGAGRRIRKRGNSLSPPAGNRTPFRVENPVTGEVTYQSYQRAEPLAFIIGATADAVEILSHAEFDDELTPEEEQAMQLVNAVVAGIAENTMSKTFLSGVADAIQAMDDPQRYFKGWTDRMAGAMVPYSALRRDLSRIDDPYIRQAWTLAEKLRSSSGIPGWSEEGPLSLDMYGQPRKYRNGAILGVLSPFPDRDMERDPVKHEIAALMEQTNLVPVTMPSKRIDGLKLSGYRVPQPRQTIPRDAGDRGHDVHRGTGQPHR